MSHVLSKQLLLVVSQQCARSCKQSISLYLSARQNLPPPVRGVTGTTMVAPPLTCTWAVCSPLVQNKTYRDARNVSCTGVRAADGWQRVGLSFL